ncbi:hypothetical protein BGZ58_006087 [Dissophora ornata]|nr:hypothetical protein BGZ58_006087 [Dissophora ornata]
MDGLLRRHILLKRTPARLQSSLLDRPSRESLAKQNILRGIHIRQHIQEGGYIGGPTTVQSYHISCRLERQMVSIRIAKKLKMRPDWTELVERGLIPEEMFVNEDEFETKRKWKSYQEQQQQKLLQDELDEPMDIKEPDTFEPQQQRQSQGDRMRSRPEFEFSVAASRGSVPPPSPPPASSAHLSTQPTHSSSTPSRSSAETAKVNSSYSSRPRRQKKAISMVLVPKIEVLRKAMDRDRLSRLVQKRPSPAELNQSPKTATVLQAYHLIAFSSTSPHLVPLTAQLNFLLKGERLSHWLYHRPSLSVILNERHILKTEVSTAWMVCPGVSKKVRFYEGLIQERRMYEQQHQRQHQLQLQHLQQYHFSQTAVA